MAYIARTIKDRVAVGDDCFYMEQLPDGRVRLIPAPDSIQEEGTPINSDLLQLIEDRVVMLMSRLFDDITSNPFTMTFNDISPYEVTCVWNLDSGRIEC